MTKQTSWQSIGSLLATFFIVAPACLAAEPSKPDESLLTLERIFNSGDFGSEHGPGLQWCKRRGGYTTLEGNNLIWHDAASDKTETIVPSHHFAPPGGDGSLSIESYAFSDDESKLLIYTSSKRVWRTRSRGDYWVHDIAANVTQKLGGDAPPSSLQFATFSPDGEQVAFISENNLYVQNLHDSRVTKLTDDGSSHVINGTFDWVYEEELGLRNGLRWSPDSRQIAYWQCNTDGVPLFPLMNNTDTLYPRVQWIAYPKVGEQNSAVRVGVVSASGGKTRWLDVPGDPREHYLAHMEWTGDARQLLLQQFNRLQNENRVLLASAERGTVTTLCTETDSAWLEHLNSHLRWFDNRRRFLWLSERDSWQHVYAVSLESGEPKLITPGSFDVISVEGIDEPGGLLYYLASPDNPGQRYLYRARLDCTGSERLSAADQPGTHNYNISPDARFAVHTYSTFDTPPVVELISLPDHKRVRLLTDNKRLNETLAKLKRPATEFFRINIGETELDAWCITPPDLDVTQRYPVVFHVYGEPAGQTVLDQWSGRSYLWHLLLAQHGYVVMSVDNRGVSAPRGREFRKCIHRQVGVLASADQAAATQALLAKLPWLDPERVAIWGWSGGGSMTLNAMFRYPKLYQTGISIAPVPNQRLYDTIYQERYMGLPGDNAEGYRRGSPVHFANQLEGNLLLVHGTGDDNCHYQGTEMLIDELVAFNKPFAMLAYPNRSHGISERKNTTRHLYSRLTQFLEEKTPPGPRPPKSEPAK